MPTRSFRGIRVFKFDAFELDVRAAELRRGGERVRLQEQPYRILAMLLERPGEVVFREEIQRRLWPNDTVVEVGHGINAAVLRLREALGDSAENPRYIETVARRGYRFRGAVETVCTVRRSSAPAVDAPNETLEGRTVSHFRVLDKLGSGGMGVVYRAQDLKLGREVALKLLPQELASDTLAVGRFQREARAASALNHPNICTVYAVEEWSGQPIIVMELLEGETLAARLAKGPLPVEKAVPVAVQIAGALDAAHRKGVVHRDLKPSNVLLTRDGAKVLDFGLAKMATAAAGDGEVTREGAIVGTLHYMSPEQVQGKDAGPASDLFSFGLVLYEMVAGKRAYAGENSAAVMSAILTAEPPEIEAPPELAPILRRCLAKDPEERWQSARDLKAALEWVVEGWRPAPAAMLQAPILQTPMLQAPTLQAPTLQAPTLPPAPAAPSKPRWYWPATAAAGIVLAVSITWMMAGISMRRVAYAPATPPEPPNIARAIMPIANAVSTAIGKASNVSLSPNARTIAYQLGGRYFLRGIDSADARPIEPIRGNGAPFWSPDGRAVAAVENGMLMTANLPEGKASAVWPVNTRMAGTWGPDGSILIGPIGDGIWRVNAVTGNAQRITQLDQSQRETRHLRPQFLPDGKHFLFVAGSATPGASALYVGSLESKARTRIATVSSNAAFVQAKGKGYLVYLRGRTLFAQVFDPGAMKTVGEAFPVAGPIAAVTAAGAAVEVADFSVTADTLVYADPRGSAAENNGITVVRNWLANAPKL